MAVRREQDQQLSELVQRLLDHPKLRVVFEMVKKMLEVYEKER